MTSVNDGKADSRIQIDAQQTIKNRRHSRQQRQPENPVDHQRGQDGEETASNFLEFEGLAEWIGNILFFPDQREWERQIGAGESSQQRRQTG